MTDQEVRKYLEAGGNKRQLLRELQKQLFVLEHSESCIKAIDYEKPSVSGGSMSDLSDTVIRGEEATKKLKERITETIAGICTWKEKAFSMIQCCEDDASISILVARFINGKSWKEIQEEYHYAESRPYVICRMAIAEIARKYQPIDQENRKQ